MKPLKHLFIGFVFAAGALAAAEPSSFQSAAMSSPPPHPALYSFVDVYRLTVAGAMAGFPLVEGAPEAPIRVAVAQGQPSAEPRFSIAAVPQPDKWLLLLAGLALAGWVAHRRLVHSL
jgi:hypothetical protein